MEPVSKSKLPPTLGLDTSGNRLPNVSSTTSTTRSPTPLIRNTNIQDDPYTHYRSFFEQYCQSRGLGGGSCNKDQCVLPVPCSDPCCYRDPYSMSTYRGHPCRDLCTSPFYCRDQCSMSTYCCDPRRPTTSTCYRDPCCIDPRYSSCDFDRFHNGEVRSDWVFRPSCKFKTESHLEYDFMGLNHDLCSSLKSGSKTKTSAKSTSEPKELQQEENKDLHSDKSKLAIRHSDAQQLQQNQFSTPKEKATSFAPEPLMDYPEPMQKEQDVQYTTRKQSMFPAYEQQGDSDVEERSEEENENGLSHYRTALLTIKEHVSVTLVNKSSEVPIGMEAQISTSKETSMGYPDSMQKEKKVAYKNRKKSMFPAYEPQDHSDEEERSEEDDENGPPHYSSGLVTKKDHDTRQEQVPNNNREKTIPPTYAQQYDSEKEEAPDEDGENGLPLQETGLVTKKEHIKVTETTYGVSVGAKDPFSIPKEGTSSVASEPPMGYSESRQKVKGLRHDQGFSEERFKANYSKLKDLNKETKPGKQSEHVPRESNSDEDSEYSKLATKITKYSKETKTTLKQMDDSIPKAHKSKGSELESTRFAEQNSENHSGESKSDVRSAHSSSSKLAIRILRKVSEASEPKATRMENSRRSLEHTDSEDGVPKLGSRESIHDPRSAYSKLAMKKEKYSAVPDSTTEDIGFSKAEILNRSESGINHESLHEEYSVTGFKLDYGAIAELESDSESEMLATMQNQESSSRTETLRKKQTVGYIYTEKSDDDKFKLDYSKNGHSKHKFEQSD